MSAPPEAQTAAGRVAGESVNGLHIFRGIPFARVPGRFRPAVPLDPWPGVRDATRFGPAAAQARDKLEAIWGVRLDPGSEDCLTVNVWTPGLDGRRPVLVLIHGGAFIIGAGQWPMMDGANLARRGDLVVVTFNYRLGVLGYLDLPDYPGSGNLGLLDQVAAFEWVRDNITAFGGDPTNVTALGQSAGSISLCALLAAPRARGLFRRAWCMSGAANHVRTPEYAARVTAKVTKLAGGADLMTVPATRLAEIQHQLLSRPDYLGELPFGPVVDGQVLPSPPLQAIANGAAADVPLVAGTTREEVRLWVLYDPMLNWIPPAALRKWLRSLGLRFRDIDMLYRGEYPLANKPQLAMAIASDALFWVPTVRLLEAQARHRPDTRMYLFAWQTQANGGQLGACHAADMPFMFGNLDAPGARRLIGSGPGEPDVSDAMVNALIAYVRSGDPNHAGIPEWPPYRPESRATLVFDTKCEVVQDPHPNVRAVWAGLPFDGVRPATTELPRVRDVKMYFFWWLLFLGGGMLTLIVATGIALLLR
jgi:para-nitrobenzyl esterase